MGLLEVIQKYKVSEHVFSDPYGAKSKSNEMGFEGAIHLYDVDGQAYYMPGPTHQAYLNVLGNLEGIPEESLEGTSEGSMLDALRVVVQEVLNKSSSEVSFENIIKVDEEQRIIYGWASVATVKGEPLVDLQGHIIPIEVLHKAVNTFMEGARVGKLMHQGKQVGQIIHSFPVTDEIMKSLGIQSDKQGWIVGYKVYDDDTWEEVKAGKWAAFSIGGRAVLRGAND